MAYQSFIFCSYLHVNINSTICFVTLLCAFVTLHCTFYALTNSMRNILWFPKLECSSIPLYLHTCKTLGLPILLLCFKSFMLEESAQPSPPWASLPRQYLSTPSLVLCHILPECILILVIHLCDVNIMYWLCIYRSVLDETVSSLMACKFFLKSPYIPLSLAQCRG